jgi:hypothetical protein
MARICVTSPGDLIDSRLPTEPCSVCASCWRICDCEAVRQCGREYRQRRRRDTAEWGRVRCVPGRQYQPAWLHVLRHAFPAAVPGRTGSRLGAVVPNLLVAVRAGKVPEESLQRIRVADHQPPVPLAHCPRFKGDGHTRSRQFTAHNAYLLTSITR